MAAVVGGIHESRGSENSAETEDLARFAVQEYNKKENALLEFVKVVNTKQQVVAGTVYYLTIEVTDAGQKKLYEAKVWVKPWLNFKEVQEFKPVADVIEDLGKFKMLLKIRGENKRNLKLKYIRIMKVPSI